MLSNSKFTDALKTLKATSIEEQLGQLEIRLGEARLEGDTTRVRVLETELNEIKAQVVPEAIIEIEYLAPLDGAAYHGLAGEIVQAIEPHSEAAPAALLMNLLTAFGNVIGSGSYFMVGIMKHFFKLFVALVGDTSKGRKGMSWSPIFVRLEAVDTEWAEHRIKTGLSSGEGVISHVQDPIYKRKIDKKTGVVDEVLVDDGVTDKRLLIIEGELAQTLKDLSREGNTLSPVLRNAWDGVKLQTLTKNFPHKATGAHVSIIGHITRQELLRGLNEIETGNGFANRFLWICVRRSKVLPFGGDFESADFKYLTNRLQATVGFARSAGRINWAEESRPLWADVYSELSDGKPGMVGAITARAEAQVVRLACLYALLDCATEITPAHLKAALAVWSYAEASVRYIFQNTVADPLANRIFSILTRNPGEMGRREINNALGRNYSADRISETLETLKGSGLANSKKIDTEGRPLKLWSAVKHAYELNE